jgi:deoxyribonuclease-4
MLPDGRRIGAHLPLGRGLVRAVDRAHELGLDTLQIFGDNPTAWRRRASPPRELPAFRARIDELAMGPIAIHAAYLINLAGPDEAFFDKSCAVLAAELRAAIGFGARFVNVHIGSHRGEGIEAGTARVAEGVARVLAEVDDGPGAATLVLENTAGSGDGVGATIEEIEGILGAIAARGVPERRVAICLDTAHLWGAGHEISRPAEVDRLVDAFADRIGLGRIAIVHFNDSKAALGSRSDRHAHLGAGSIGAEGLRAFLCHPRLAHATYYLETPGMDEGYDAVNAARIHDLAAGRPLAELPAEAHDVRGSRSRTHPAADGDEP